MPSPNGIDHMFLNDEEAAILLAILESGIAALHNHIALGVEKGVTEGVLEPASLVRKLRRRQHIATRIRGFLYKGDFSKKLPAEAD